MATKDLYSVLGLERSASLEDVKRAYRKLARKLHPDVNPGDPAAENRFKEVSAAFEVLGDPDRRKLYDEFGDEALRSGFEPEKARAYREWRQRAEASRSFGARPVGAEDVFGADGFDLGDLFAGFGAGAGPGTRGRRDADIHAEMSIPFRDAILGIERELQFARPTRCGRCSGAGSVPATTRAPCPQCDGTGRRSVGSGPLAFHATCPQCGGSGDKPGPTCGECRGTGYTDQMVRLKVRVPPGVSDGQTIRLAGQGIGGDHGRSAGDLLIRVRVDAHPVLRRQGRDLLLEVPVTIREAMMGATIEVPTLTGPIKLTVPAGVQSGIKLRARGRGVPASSASPAGDLYVVVKVQVPSPDRDPTAAQEAADQIERLYTADVRRDLRV